MPVPMAAAVAAIPWLLSAVVCCFMAIYTLIVLVALLHPDQQRRTDARAVLRLHLQALSLKRGNRKLGRPGGSWAVLSSGHPRVAAMRR